MTSKNNLQTESYCITNFQGIDPQTLTPEQALKDLKECPTMQNFIIEYYIFHNLQIPDELRKNRLSGLT